MGASTKAPADLEETSWARDREVAGSMVEQSMKRREVGSLGREEEMMDSITDLTCCGSGREVIMVS